MDIIIYHFFFAFSAYVILKLVIEPELKLRKKIKASEEKKRNSISPSVKKKKDEVDFLGTELLKNDPKKFLQNVEQNREKLKRGEMIGVDAAQAFFLIRTSSHNGMIVSEDGTINMKDLSDFTNINSDNEKLEELQREILEYQPKDRDMSQVKTFQVPGYVKEVVKVRGDIVRWVYHDWHAEECGIKSICFDKHSRLVKDPDDESEDHKKTKSSSKKSSHKKDDEQDGGSENEIKDLSKKISRMIEMQEEYLHIKKYTSTQETLFDLCPVKYKAEEQQLDEEFAAELEKKELEDEAVEFYYEDKEAFLKEIAPREDFFEKVFEFITAEKENFGRILYDDARRIIYIEKNFFSKCVANCFSKKYRFKRDFILGDSSDFYDGQKVSRLVEVMNRRKVFSKTDNEGYIFKMLFMSDEREDVCYKGWFISMPIGGYTYMDDFVNYYSESISVISSSPKEIDRTAKRYSNVIVSY